MMTEKLLIAICKLLESEGYKTLKAYDGLDAIDILNQNTVHLIILDIMMPNQDGLTTTMKIRNEKNIPIILLSAKTQESDIVLGLSMGADDYISKPYAPSELLARVKSQTRRYLKLGSYGNISSNEEIITNLGLELNVTKKQLFVDGVAVNITAKEYKIVNYLMQQSWTGIFSRENI